MAPFKLLNLLALASVAIVALSNGPVSANALDIGRAQVARHAHAARGHDAVAKRKRTTSTTSTGRCKPNPSTSSAPSSATSAAPSSSYSPPPSSSASASASSSAPSSSPSSGGGSNSGSKKWGLGWPNGDTSSLTTFAQLPKVGYLYTWSPYLPSGLSDLGIEGIPMLWGWNQVDDFQKLVVPGYAKYVLGMNEPNEPSQSNMSPQSGAQLWQQYIQPLAGQGYTLISPACTNDQAGLDWMAGFFSACTGCTIDAVAFHFYSTNATAFISYATQLYNTYNLPVWVTEFADQNFSGTGGQADMDDVYAFAATITSFIDNTWWMQGAFPFGAMPDLQGVNMDNLLLGTNGQPTSLAYNYFG
ncbi:hypothetical protein BV22DRAFT_1040027 [Leucogyrophana mollusca]|uniref:Uncharacterized protein n=1 Tax=Leucogyrophana mollusca TaxID=85980 RepID=A0ACB8B401_9AGAM|nr:hypothetical protein BV22DRAFT_1040027 [Leucogyrophana mollusca]